MSSVLKRGEPRHWFEPTPLQCGQAVLAMLAGVTPEEIARFLGNERETDFREMKRTLEHFGFRISGERRPAHSLHDLPEIALLSLQTPKCWHWSLFYKGRVLDPEYGVLEDFPESERKYFWEIKA